MPRKKQTTGAQKHLPAARSKRAVNPAPLAGLPTRIASNAYPASATIGFAAFEYIEHLQRLDDPAAIRAAFAEAVVALGVTNFALLEVNPDPDAFQKGIIDDTMPMGWKQRYFDQRYADVDPCVSEIMTSLEPFLWSEALSRSRREKAQRQVYHEAADFGLNEGMCVPIFGPNRYMAFATLAGPALDLSPRARAALHVMALYTHNRLMMLMRASLRPRPVLTNREAECLKWVAQGKTDWEIGEILKISERTAHWYIECAKRKFGVSTRIQAVVNAAANGLIAF